MLYELHQLADYAIEKRIDGVLGDLLKAFNVFQYITFRAAGAALTSFLISIWFGDRVILKLLSLRLGQPIRNAAEVHRLAELHGGKIGTPTMGGILYMGSMIISALIWARWDNPYVWLSLLTVLVLGGLGFADDYAKVRYRNSKGVPGRVKLIVQFALGAAIAGFFLYSKDTMGINLGETARSLYAPFFKAPLLADMGLLCFVFYTFVIMGSSNAVNLTDGLDGLASGCTLVCALSYAGLTYAAGNIEIARYLLIPYAPYSGEMCVMCMALAGSSLGFLWFNCYPARVFMGDTGSLAIGGFLAFAAIASKQEILLSIIGGVFVIEAMSVIMQVASYKYRGKKRIFLMAPIHHHFELSGWKETTVIVRFWILSIIFALMGLATLKLR